jgi:dipeptidase D
MTRIAEQAVDRPPQVDPVYAELDPVEVWRHFSMLNSIPRPSGGEKRVRSHICSLASEHGAAWEIDDAGNTVVRVPPSRTAGGDAPTVAVQSHLDMVCEAESGVEHDFWGEPIRPRLKDGMVYATGTTLGADDGIGVAAALALLTVPNIRHGPLELLFTVDEERGLRGALALDPSLLSARLLINLDSEDPDKLIDGSAGSRETLVRLPLRRETISGENWSGRRLELSGLRGGHSGLDIQRKLANALKLLDSTLAELREAGVPVLLAALRGGTARNAIPRSAAAEIALPEDSLGALTEAIDSARRKLYEEWGDAEPGLELSISELPRPETALTAESLAALLGLLAELPHGVLAVNGGESGPVRTSCSLASVEVATDRTELSLTSRSLVESDLDRIQAEIAEIAADFGATAHMTFAYPPWTPSGSGPLLSLAADVFREVNNRPAQVEAMHAGLECGLIVAKVPDMEAISFGPLIRAAHTPREHLGAATVMPMWLLLVQLLNRLADIRAVP